MSSAHVLHYDVHERGSRALPASKAWKDAEWFILEKTRSGELCQSAVDDEYCRESMATADVMIVSKMLVGRSKQIIGFALARLTRVNPIGKKKKKKTKDVASGSRGIRSPGETTLVVDVVCSKVGGGASMIQRIKQYARASGAASVSLLSLAPSIMFYRKMGFENAHAGDYEASHIAADASQFVGQVYGTVDAIKKDPAFLAFVMALASLGLTKDRNCRTIEDCNINGYHMVYYIPPSIQPASAAAAPAAAPAAGMEFPAAAAAAAAEEVPQEQQKPNVGLKRRLVRTSSLRQVAARNE